MTKNYGSEMLSQLDSAIHSFDKFGEQVANINMKGKTRYTTRLGGICGILIFSLISWFTIIRF